MRLPQSMDFAESENLIFFTAKMALRRLTNRIIGSLYSPENVDISLLTESPPTPDNVNLNQLLALSSELNRQLDQHYSTIPIQPPLTTDPTSTPQRRRLHLRALFARQLIHRPFVLYVSLQPPTTATVFHTASATASPIPSSSSSPAPQYPIPRILLERCHTCLQSAESYIHDAGELLDKRTPHLWSVAQGCVSSFAVLILAERSSHLHPLTPDLEALAMLIASRLRRWATPGSLFVALLDILQRLLADRQL